MDSFSGRSGRQPVHREPTPQPRPSEAPAHHSAPPVVPQSPRSLKDASKGKKGIVLGLLLFGLALWGGIAGYNELMMSRLIDGGKYQAVFLTNGQVYFGKLSRVGGNTYKLNKIFYLQAAQTSTAEEDAKNPQKTSTTNSDVQLIKLGNEVHGPDDQMIIDKAQVLFYENLTKDGKVSQSIEKYYADKK